VFARGVGGVPRVPEADDGDHLGWRVPVYRRLDVAVVANEVVTQAVDLRGEFDGVSVRVQHQRVDVLAVGLAGVDVQVGQVLADGVGRRLLVSGSVAGVGRISAVRLTGSWPPIFSSTPGRSPRKPAAVSAASFAVQTLTTAAWPPWARTLVRTWRS